MHRPLVRQAFSPFGTVGNILVIRGISRLTGPCRRGSTRKRSRLSTGSRTCGSLRQQLWRMAAAGPAPLSLGARLHLRVEEGGLCSTVMPVRELATRQQ